MQKIGISAILIAVIMGVTGCFSALEISKCREYTKGICVTKEKRTVYLCKKPLKLNGKVYCDK